MMCKKRLRILPGCIGCGLCQALAPKVFKVNNVSKVNEGISFSKYEKEINEAVASCPVKVISFKECD